METNRLRYTCSFMKSSTIKRSNSTWILAFSIVFLHFFSVVSKSWYTVYLDLDSCLSCAPIIITLGTVFENSAIKYSDHDFILTDNHVQTKDTMDTLLDSLIERQPGEVVIETGVFVHIGLWTLTSCLEDGHTCVDMDHSTSSIILRNFQPIADMLESAYDCRPFLLLAIISHILMLFSTRLRPAGPTVSDVRITASLEAGSAVLSLMAAVIASMPYITARHFYHFVSPLLPWALFTTILASYLSCLLAYNIWNSQNSRRDSFRTWQVHQLYKYHV